MDSIKIRTLFFLDERKLFNLFYSNQFVKHLILFDNNKFVFCSLNQSILAESTRTFFLSMTFIINQPTLLYSTGTFHSTSMVFMYNAEAFSRHNLCLAICLWKIPRKWGGGGFGGGAGIGVWGGGEGGRETGGGKEDWGKYFFYCCRCELGHNTRER